MEILQFLLSFFASEYDGGKFEPIFNTLKENSFDIKKTLSSLDLKTVAPLILQTFKNSPSQTQPVWEGEKLNPIINVADKKIVSALNDYFATT